MRYDVLKQHVTSRTKALIINNPNNPTGRVYSVEELQAAAQVATKTSMKTTSW